MLNHTMRVDFSAYAKFKLMIEHIQRNISLDAYVDIEEAINCCFFVNTIYTDYNL